MKDKQYHFVMSMSGIIWILIGLLLYIITGFNFGLIIGYGLGLFIYGIFEFYKLK